MYAACVNVLRLLTTNPQEGPAGEELLPSVMTCTSSLKLPDYSTKAVMRAKLLVSILNCSTGFQMS